jgi:hypothetical protein
VAEVFFLGREKIRSGFRGIPGPPRSTRQRAAARRARALTRATETPPVPTFPRTLPPVRRPSSGRFAVARGPCDAAAGGSPRGHGALNVEDGVTEPRRPRAERAPGRASAFTRRARLLQSVVFAAPYLASIISTASSTTRAIDASSGDQLMSSIRGQKT